MTDDFLGFHISFGDNMGVAVDYLSGAVVLWAIDDDGVAHITNFAYKDNYD